MSILTHVYPVLVSSDGLQASQDALSLLFHAEFLSFTPQCGRQTGPTVPRAYMNAHVMLINMQYMSISLLLLTLCILYCIFTKKKIF